jgi:hypothetical protein
MILLTAYRVFRDFCLETARLRRELTKRYPDASFEG